MLRRTFLYSTAAAAVLYTIGSRRLLAAGSSTTMNHDPLLSPWVGAHGGVPPFDQIAAKDLRPALGKAMDLNRAEIAAIISNPAPPTFDNTIAALEDAGRPLGRAGGVFGIYKSALNDKQMQKVEVEMAPLLAAFDDEVTQNEQLFARIKTVYDGRNAAKLTADELRLVDVVYRAFARKGAALGKRDKAKLKEINGRLASLYTRFSQNELADEEGYTLPLEGEADLAGLPESVRASAKSAAEAKGLAGKWLITNTRSSMDPFLTYSSRRDLREKAWRLWVNRGDNAGAHDNKPVITEILSLRATRARLLGFPSHAHWIVDDNMAKTPDAAMALMMKVWHAAVVRSREEIGDMQKVADAEGAGHKIAPWDYRYYAEKVRKAKYDLDENEVKPYLQLDKMREAMFWAAGQIYGFDFTRLAGIPTYHPDMSVYEVTRDGRRVGLWYFDPYARDGKQSGAWMNEYRTQEQWKEPITPIVSNNANFVKGKPGAAVLISWDDAVTMFHEFGHALHGLNSNVRFATLAGTNVKRDFVEFPSQLNEHWLITKEVLNRFAVHYQTGKPIPPALVAKIEKARHFNQGFKTVEYLAAAIYDMKIHSVAVDKPIDAGEFEKHVMKEIGCPSEIVMRHRPTQFGHIFSGDGYSAGYYSYIWADTLTADAAEAFAAAGSFYDKPTAKRLYESIMSVGNSIPPAEAFHRFRGRDVDTNALMRDRGFPVVG
ncbi:MAG: peptidyl-dipeptidase Dcp [bacterium]|nr:peptidyl-dipeptidase Dcp [bacterium]